jgi:hypothetical protein
MDAKVSADIYGESPGPQQSLIDVENGQALVEPVEIYPARILIGCSGLSNKVVKTDRYLSELPIATLELQLARAIATLLCRSPISMRCRFTPELLAPF